MAHICDATEASVSALDLLDDYAATLTGPFRAMYADCRDDQTAPPRPLTRTDDAWDFVMRAHIAMTDADAEAWMRYMRAALWFMQHYSVRVNGTRLWTFVHARQAHQAATTAYQASLVAAFGLCAARDVDDSRPRRYAEAAARSRHRRSPSIAVDAGDGEGEADEAQERS